MRKLFLILIFFVSGNLVKAQDIQFSQFYAAPIFLNPAFAGSSEMTRFGVNYRNQWPGLDHSLNAYSAYFDHYFFNLNSGVGLILNSMNETMAGLSTSEVGLAYAYRLQLGFNTFLRLGGQASYFSRDANFNQLVFESQVNRGTGAIGDFSGELLGSDSRHRYFDYHFGMLLNNKFGWLGVSAHHITQPNISFIDDQISEWPMKLSIHGGWTFNLSNWLGGNLMSDSQNQRELTFAFNYRRQEPFSQFDIGAQLHLQPMVIGLWYRGLPTIGKELPNNEAIIGLLGVSIGNGLYLGYSYDFTLSQLGQANTGGAHEVSMRLSFLAGDAKQSGRKASILPCFKY
ncbi:MAG: PorP/SprF family type IX secretion system membrane protein [Cecembia sp.]